ncbi:hypothetical protein DSUL_20439 [Desulfovibrionales bacterium]
MQTVHHNALLIQTILIIFIMQNPPLYTPHHSNPGLFHA